MADSWAGNPATWTVAEAVTAAKMNTEIRDRMDALLAGLKGDTSADSDIRQAVKNGALSARPAASLAGREYFATDTRQMFVDTGSTWRHVSGAFYDSFTRANNTLLTTSDSGHAWTENSGDMEILSNRLHGLTAGISTVDTGGVIESAEFHIDVVTHTTAASINVAIPLRFVDTSNYLYAQLTASAWRLQKAVAGVHTTLATLALTPVGNQPYVMDISVMGPIIIGRLAAIIAAGTVSLWVWDTPADTVTPFSTATKCGVNYGSVGAGSDTVEAYAVKF